MKIKITRNTASKGVPFVVGDTPDLPEDEAKMLILCCKATVLETATAEPVIETASATRKRPRKQR